MRFLITAGPTREFLDPVRFLSNRSTGKMGYAVAESALRRKHGVTLISGPVALAEPKGARVVGVVSAREMLAAVKRHLPHCDALVMCAAVADWRPAKKAATKLKKRTMAPVMALVPNPDILLAVRAKKGRRLFVGFAAETGRMEAEARDKLRRKGLDMIVANDIRRKDAGFEADTNRVALITVERTIRLPLMSKRDVGKRIVEWCEGRSQER